LKYKKESSKFVAHFMGITRAESGGHSIEIPLINPMWVNLHFHEKFVAIVVAFAAKSDAWVPVPCGSARSCGNALPPQTLILESVFCHYHQGDQEYCMFYSFASALFHLGFYVESEEVRMAGHKLEYKDSLSQLDGFRSVVSKLTIFRTHPVIWGQRGRKFKRFNVLENISEDPTLIIPLGGDGGISHGVTTVGRLIFDSTHPRALYLAKESLDWCCNTKLGFIGVYFAMRLPLKQISV
jgi:hypothetical protein